MKKFYGCMLLCRNAEGVLAKAKVEIPWFVITDRPACDIFHPLTGTEPTHPVLGVLWPRGVAVAPPQSTNKFTVDTLVSCAASVMCLGDAQRHVLCFPCHQCRRMTASCMTRIQKSNSRVTTRYWKYWNWEISFQDFELLNLAQMYMKSKVWKF